MSSKDAMLGRIRSALTDVTPMAPADDVDVDHACEFRPAGSADPSPAILRLRARDAEGVPVGGTAVLTLYATGSWTWGGDADAIAYAREPLERHGVMPC